MYYRIQEPPNLWCIGSVSKRSKPMFTYATEICKFLLLQHNLAHADSNRDLLRSHIERTYHKCSINIVIAVTSHENAKNFPPLSDKEYFSPDRHFLFTALNSPWEREHQPCRLPASTLRHWNQVAPLHFLCQFCECLTLLSTWFPEEVSFPAQATPMRALLLTSWVLPQNSVIETHVSGPTLFGLEDCSYQQNWGGQGSQMDIVIGLFITVRTDSMGSGLWS